MASRNVGRRRADPKGNRRRALDIPQGHGHGHGHGHGDHVVDTSVVNSDAVVARRVRIVVAAILIPLITAAVVLMIALWPGGGVKVDSYQTSTARGEVTAIKACPDPKDKCDLATVKVSNGPDKGKAVPVEVPSAGQTPFAIKAGQSVMLGIQDGAPLDQRYQYVDHDRSRPLLILAVIFAIAVVALSRWRGFAALIALAVTAVMLTQFILPAILKGSNPLVVAVVGGAVIMTIAVFLTHGINAESSIALAGTIAALGLTVLLGWFFAKFSQLSGLAADGASAAKSFAPNLDLTGLLVAGMVIGALGVLDDVTVTQAAAVWELSAANPSASRRELMSAGLRIGRTHVASVVNTLVLAYAGAAMPVLIVFAIQDLPTLSVISTESVAMEVVRGLIGSLGIIAAVPLTTALAAMAVADRSRELVADAERL
ncbi:putative membrane protein [Kribbella sp. VKM Ac-2569]|uniref:YibE/F family protein n=1 Tax=Kribbella sp. VKM Ac-2569 TaxID=2512220 RepID=UPI00102B1C75|nr:YibE/F family protein [Kribbella sp. VKM Ac-2569]RZT27142.1 putative membrane protein [Kribbella sp. VKM Ac-2569]